MISLIRAARSHPVFRCQVCEFPYNPTLPSSSSSSVSPQDDTCLKAYDELKLGKKLKYVVYGLTPDMKAITTLKKADLQEGAEFETFVENLPEKECRWGVYDMEYDQGEGKRNKLCFVMWYVGSLPYVMGRLD